MGDEKKQQKFEHQQRSLRVLENIAVKILENDNEPKAQRLLAEWVKKYHPNWFQAITSVPLNLMEDFEPLIKK